MKPRMCFSLRQVQCIGTHHLTKGLKLKEKKKAKILFASLTGPLNWSFPFIIVSEWQWWISLIHDDLCQEV